MINFICDNPALERSLKKLHEEVADNQAWFSDSIVVEENNGDLAVYSGLTNNLQTELMVIPEDCLPYVDNFEIRIDSNDLVIGGHSRNTSKLHVCLMESIIDIFNITNKIQIHSHTNPWLSLDKAPKIIQKLFEGRASSSFIKKYYKNYRSGNTEQLLRDTFFGSRMLAYRSPRDKHSRNVLMPFIDFLNHHYQSPGYEMRTLDPNSRSELYVWNSMPIPDSNECFVSYKVMDALDTYLAYGFVDTYVPYVCSVPLKIHLQDIGTIFVYSYITQYYEKPLPAYLQDLRQYMPTIRKTGRNEIHVSRLLIPGNNAPMALRRVLAHIISNLSPDMTENRIADSVLYAEELILSENTSFYNELKLIIYSIEDNKLPHQSHNTLGTLLSEQGRKLGSYSLRLRKQNV